MQGSKGIKALEANTVTLSERNTAVTHLGQFYWAALFLLLVSWIQLYVPLLRRILFATWHIAILRFVVLAISSFRTSYLTNIGINKWHTEWPYRLLSIYQINPMKKSSFTSSLLCTSCHLLTLTLTWGLAREAAGAAAEAASLTFFRAATSDSRYNDSRIK